MFHPLSHSPSLLSASGHCGRLQKSSPHRSRFACIRACQFPTLLVPPLHHCHDCLLSRSAAVISYSRGRFTGCSQPKAVCRLRSVNEKSATSRHVPCREITRVNTVQTGFSARNLLAQPEANAAKASGMAIRPPLVDYGTPSSPTTDGPSV